MSEELLPCPLCGGCPVLTDAMTEHWVSCGTCGASGGMHGRLKLAVEAWNRRTPAPEGEAVAWRLRRVGVVRWNLWDLDPRVDTPAYADAAEWEVQPLYASPVVPAPEGEAWRHVSQEEVAQAAKFASTNLASPVVPAPEGEAWRTVPVEPTEAMLVNGREALMPLVRLDSYGPLIGVWEDMLAASPVVPVGVSEDQRQRVAEIVEAAIERHAPTKGICHTLDDADAILAALRPTDTGRE